MSWRVIHLDNSTDGGASLRHLDRMAECCGLLSNGGIAPDDLHKWADVLDLALAKVPAAQPARGDQ